MGATDFIPMSEGVWVDCPHCGEHGIRLTFIEMCCPACGGQLVYQVTLDPADEEVANED